MRMYKVYLNGAENSRNILVFAKDYDAARKLGAMFFYKTLRERKGNWLNLRAKLLDNHKYLQKEIKHYYAHVVLEPDVCRTCGVWDQGEIHSGECPAHRSQDDA